MIELAGYVLLRISVLGLWLCLEIIISIGAG